MRKITLLFVIALIALTTSSCRTIYQKMKYSDKDILISNPCAGEEMDFKLVSLKGDKDSQTMTLHGRLINRNVNKDIYVGKNLVAYDCLGVAHNSSNGSSTKLKARTDEKVYFSVKIPGQVVPKKVKKMAAITFDIDNCRVEIRNVPIIWEKNKNDK